MSIVQQSTAFTENLASLGLVGPAESIAALSKEMQVLLEKLLPLHKLKAKTCRCIQVFPYKSLNVYYQAAFDLESAKCESYFFCRHVHLCDAHAVV